MDRLEPLAGLALTGRMGTPGPVSGGGSLAGAPAGGLSDVRGEGPSASAYVQAQAQAQPSAPIRVSGQTLAPAPGSVQNQAPFLAQASAPGPDQSPAPALAGGLPSSRASAPGSTSNPASAPSSSQSASAASGAGAPSGRGARVLEARGLGFAYPEVGEVLCGVDLTLHAGDRLVLAGANGSGKTTLLLLLAGLLIPREGDLLCDGEPRGRSRRAMRAWHSRVGLVFQDPDDQLFAPTVFEDVSFGPLNQGCDAALTRFRVDRALAALGIADLAERPPHMLSFGQKKRVSIAGVLAMEPGVLLLDEPTAGLDPEACADLLETLGALAAGGTAVVVATHTMDEAWAWADRIALFGGRRIVACGPPEEIFRDRSRLEQLHLREPLLFGVARRLADAGLLPPGQPLPRTQEALFSLLSQGT